LLIFKNNCKVYQFFSQKRKGTAVTSYGQRGARAPPEIFENLSVGLKG